MRKFRVSLIGFLVVVTSVVFLFILGYERYCSNLIQSRSVTIPNPAIRAMVELDLNALQLEQQLETSQTRFELKYHPNENELIPSGARRELSNIRNRQLKLHREKARLTVLRQVIVHQSVKPRDQ